MNKQTVVPKTLIVLGNDHGADLKWLKENKINYIYYDSSSMGKLRNIGLDNIKTTWKLYFSVDDELLPHTCEEIINSNSDAVSLTFNVHNIDGSIEENCLSPLINTKEDLKNKFRWGGYVAFKNSDARFREDVEIPNILFHIELFKRGAKVIRSKGVCAICHRWDKSHGLRTMNTNIRTDMLKILKEEIDSI